MAIYVFLILFSPSFQWIAVTTVWCFAAKFAHYQRLVIGCFPCNSVSFFRQTIVPPDVFVTAHYIQILTQGIVYHLCFGVGVMTLHCGCEKSGWIKSARAFGQRFQEMQSRLSSWCFVCYRPQNDGS